jgi:hypothetical protein
MRFIENNWIPFNGFGLMNILGLVFSRKPIEEITKRSKLHEFWHTMQQLELLAIGGFVALILCNIYASWWYLLALPIVPFAIYVASWLAEWFIPPYHNAQLLWNDKSLPFYKRFSRWFTVMWLDAYRDNCFEREAYANEDNPDYLFERRWCGWAWYALKKVDRNGK